MGHYWREMCPDGANEHDKKIDRKLKLSEQLKRVPLGEFSAGELGAVMKLFGLAYNSAGRLEPNEEDFKILEGRARTRKCNN